MTIMSEQHALKFVCRQIRKKGNPIGSADRPFLDEIFAGRSPSKNEIHLLLGGVDQGVDRNQLFVAERDEFGGLVTVDLFDCSKKAEEAAEECEQEVAVKPTLTNVELLEILCEKLQNRRNDEGLIITGFTKPRLIKEFYDELCGEYDVVHEQIKRVFTALHNLDIRDNSAKLRKAGMQFDATELMQRLGGSHVEVSDREMQLKSRCDELEQEVARLKGVEIAQQEHIRVISEELRRSHADYAPLVHENANLTTENNRLHQSNSDLRIRNAALAEFENSVRIAMEKYDENR